VVVTECRHYLFSPIRVGRHPVVFTRSGRGQMQRFSPGTLTVVATAAVPGLASASSASAAAHSGIHTAARTQPGRTAIRPLRTYRIPGLTLTWLAQPK
jgi:hypothetical protein